MNFSLSISQQRRCSVACPSITLAVVWSQKRKFQSWLPPWFCTSSTVSRNLIYLLSMVQTENSLNRFWLNCTHSLKLNVHLNWNYKTCGGYYKDTETMAAKQNTILTLDCNKLSCKVKPIDLVEQNCQEKHYIDSPFGKKGPCHHVILDLE